MMRTTLNLPTDVYDIARDAARAQNISLGEAVARLARRGLKAAVTIDRKKAFPCFVLPVGAEAITLEQTLAAEDEP